MLKFFGYAAAAIVAIILVIFAIAATKPATYTVERSIVIAAPPEKITPLLADFHNWAIWSPWEHLDPAMQKTFTGAPSGTGAIYQWSGNAKAGQGRMEILSATPTATDIKLDFIKPFPSSSTSLFTLAPDPAGTHVTWSMSGPQPFFPTKVMAVFVTMDKMIGGDFEQGLATLKTAAQTR